MGMKLRRPDLGSSGHDAYLADVESILILVMIEKTVAVDNLDMVLEKAKARGVDMTQWGPADFGFSRGQPDLMDTDEIKPFEELVIRKSIDYGISPRIEIRSVDQAERYIGLGVKHFCVGWDRFIYQSALANIGEGMQKLLSSL